MLSNSFALKKDTVKKAIIEYLDDDKEAVKEFKQILKDNQLGQKEARYFDIADKDTKKKKDETTFIVAFKSPAVHAVIIMLMTFYLIYVCYEIGLIIGNML